MLFSKICVGGVSNAIKQNYDLPNSLTLNTDNERY